MSQDKKISIVIPVYNEEGSITSVYNDLKSVVSSFDYEIIFINDGSIDGTMEKLRSFCQADSRIKVIEFSRNFGKEVATTAGINHCSGGACIIMDGDGQHPVELILEFIEKWQAGAEVVIGVRQKNKGEGIVKAIGSWFFYKIMSLISETKVVPRSTDYRLLDRQVVNEFNRLTERSRMTRGLIDWLGFRKDYVSFNAKARIKGKASYSFTRLLKLALSSFVSHSLFPLKFAGYLGIIITFFSGILGTFIVIENYILHDPWHLDFSGPAMLAVMILFLIGIVLVCLGLIALYIASIHSEVIGRPMYVVRKKENFE